MTDRAKAMWPFVAFCGVNVTSCNLNVTSCNLNVTSCNLNVTSLVVFSIPISLYLEITRPTSW